MKRIETGKKILLKAAQTSSKAVFNRHNGVENMQKGYDPTALIAFYLLILFLIVAAWIVVTIFCIYWIGRNAARRGMPNAKSIRWFGLLGPIGLLIYILQRPRV